MVDTVLAYRSQQHNLEEGNATSPHLDVWWKPSEKYKFGDFISILWGTGVRRL